MISNIFYIQIIFKEIYDNFYNIDNWKIGIVYIF